MPSGNKKKKRDPQRRQQIKQRARRATLRPPSAALPSQGSLNEMMRQLGVSGGTDPAQLQSMLQTLMPMAQSVSRKVETTAPAEADHQVPIDTSRPVMRRVRSVPHPAQSPSPTASS